MISVVNCVRERKKTGNENEFMNYKKIVFQTQDASDKCCELCVCVCVCVCVKEREREREDWK